MQGFPQPEISSLEKLRKLTQTLPVWQTKSLESYGKKEVGKPEPIPEFCLGQEHLDYVSGYLDGITKAFNADKFPSLGMMWSHIYPLL